MKMRLPAMVGVFLLQIRFAGRRKKDDRFQIDHLIRIE
jgi:hypothetical protein